MNPTSQVQVNLTTQPSSGDNSTYDYSGNRFFNGRGGRNFGRNNRGGRTSGRGCGGCDCFADVQCQICYKFGHGASFCYHRLEENYVPTLPPPASPAPAQTQTATA